MIKHIAVPKLSDLSGDMSFALLNTKLQGCAWHVLDQVPWPDQYPYFPAVQFRLAYTASCIIIQYQVEEAFVKAQHIRANENVFEDSCVEFFVSLDDKKTYFNFEFNVLGTGIIGYGPALRTDRRRLSAEQIDRVDVFTQLVKLNGQKKWEIFLLIPIDIMTSEPIVGKVVYANFYKCGDGLPNPHYISWHAIQTPMPNFHQPQSFGSLYFEP